jgi:hypothetical protein
MAGPDTKCSPSCLRDIIVLLPPTAKKRIEDIGFSKLLQFNLDGLGSRVLYGEFMSKGIVRKDEIEFPVREDMSIWVTEKVVQDVLPMPAGFIKELPNLNDAAKEDAAREYDMMFEALVHVSNKEEKVLVKANKGKEKKGKDKKGKGTLMDDASAPNQGNQNAAPESQETQNATPPVNQETQNATPPVDHESQNATPENQENAADLLADYKRGIFKPKNIELLAKYFEDEEVCKTFGIDGLVKLFFGVVLERLLLPGTSFIVTAARLQQVHDLDKLRDID